MYLFDVALCLGVSVDIGELGIIFFRHSRWATGLPGMRRIGLYIRDFLKLVSKYDRIRNYINFYSLLL
jgi:hypothetical protein